jgi:peptidoglycan/LPS O-acetylase OafA/YrhL
MKKIESIQSLRGIAAIMIVIIHATALSDYYLKASSPRLTFQLNSGVDIFFVISGIIMSALLFRTKEFNPIDFLTRRIIRVAPLYWICTLVWCFIFFQQAASNPSLLIRSILFIPPLGENDELEPFLAIGWSLTYEIFFYLTLAIF